MIYKAKSLGSFTVEHLRYESKFVVGHSCGVIVYKTEKEGVVAVLHGYADGDLYGLTQEKVSASDLYKQLISFNAINDGESVKLICCFGSVVAKKIVSPHMSVLFPKQSGKVWVNTVKEMVCGSIAVLSISVMK